MIADDLPDPNFYVTAKQNGHSFIYDVPFKIQMGACLEDPDLPLSHE